MATECVTEIVPTDADVRILLVPKRGGQRVRVLVEYDTTIIESVQVVERRIDQPAPRTA